jgi:hypothetical protein
MHEDTFGTRALLLSTEVKKLLEGLKGVGQIQRQYTT